MPKLKGEKTTIIQVWPDLAQFEQPRPECIGSLSVGYRTDCGSGLTGDARIKALPLKAYPPIMTETDVQRFQREAERCRKLAKAARNQSDKEAWMQLASDWTHLAEQAEQRQED